MSNKRRDFDLYETPKGVVDDLFDLIPVRPTWRYLEPCRASGRIYDRLPEGSLWAEIREGVDYLNTEYQPVDCVITNPPFSLAKEFIEKSLKEARVVIMLLRINFLESKKRRALWEEFPVDHLVVLSKRPSFTGDGKTDGTGYAWFIWDKDSNLGLDRAFYWV